MKFLDACWAKSGYQTNDITDQGFIFPQAKFYADGICDEKLNIFEFSELKMQPLSILKF